LDMKADKKERPPETNGLTPFFYLVVDENNL
jgi:hypothetical protein